MQKQIRHIWLAMLLGLPLLGLNISLAQASITANPLANKTNNIAQGLPPAKNQSLKVLNAFSGEFRILGRKDYNHDPEARFSPVDFAVSEGVLASKYYYPLIGVHQDNRFLTWSMKRLPLPPQQAKELVSNIHIIPANPNIAKQLQQVKRGDMVQLSGELVEIDDNGQTWRSSLSRDDVGEGACEILRVSSIRWVEKSVA